jgi:hypothetical protein
VFFQVLTNALNTELPVGENPYNSFNLVPTTADYAIHNVPVHVLPLDPTELFQTMKDAIGFSNGAIISGARFLKPNPEDRMKATTSIVVSVTPDQAALLTESIRLFSRPRKCEKMFSSSPITQCRNCCKFGHPAQLCKNEHPTCPICAGRHNKMTTAAATMAALKEETLSQSQLAVKQSPSNAQTVAKPTPPTTPNVQKSSLPPPFSTPELTATPHLVLQLHQHHLKKMTLWWTALL